MCVVSGKQKPSSKKNYVRDSLSQTELCSTAQTSDSGSPHQMTREMEVRTGEDNRDVEKQAGSPSLRMVMEVLEAREGASSF